MFKESTLFLKKNKKIHLKIFLENLDGIFLACKQHQNGKEWGALSHDYCNLS